jgi:hypothetical protein
VRLRSAQRVEAGYARLRHQHGGSTKAVRRAERNGWLGPDWWDDDTIDDPSYRPPLVDERHWSDIDPVAVERACNGEPVPLTRAERITAILGLHERGVSHREIARRLHLPDRSVLRHLADHVEQIAS